jgi:hypothetical protein
MEQNPIFQNWLLGVIMKALIASITLILLFITTTGYSQSKETENITVNIRRVSKSQTNKDAGIEIELTNHNPNGFYVGALYWCLQIGKLPGVGAGGFPHYTAEGQLLLSYANASPKTRLFGFSKDEWKKMKNGDPMRLTWGCGKTSDYEEIEPFAFLNKKILKK